MSNAVSTGFITEDFLLDNEPARKLYHRYAAEMPIIDYHCHLSSAEIADDKRWDNLAQLWLGGDHYKWRAMRAAGVAEPFCTGAASDAEKFGKFAETVPKLLRNPLYHWTHLELKRYFGVGDRLLGPDTAKDIYDQCNRRIRDAGFSCRAILRQSRVEVVCTTDDPVDSLEDHRAIAADTSFSVRVLPTWRPDKALAIDRPAIFHEWLARLEEVTNRSISTLDSLLDALRERHEFFAEHGCRLSDRGVSAFTAVDCTADEAKTIFAKVRSGQNPSPEDTVSYQSFLLHELAVMDAEKGWTQQIHFGVMRNVNSRKFAELGPDAGFDTLGDWSAAESLARFFDRLERIDRLPKTILYNLNPRDNEMTAAMLGNFQDGVTPGKMQYGPGWWFLDQLDGMTRQIETLSQFGLLSQFVGMTTDSRSFLSFARHEYFRRLLCSILGNDIARGRIPNDLSLVGKMVEDICYNNAKKYFGFL
jgi:glucuronate isomerase